MLQTDSEVQANTQPVQISNKDECTVYLLSLPGGSAAVDHAIKQAETCRRTQATSLHIWLARCAEATFH